MLLAIDTGNTQTVIGLFDGTDLADHWRIATAAERTSDELALMFQQFLLILKIQKNQKNQMNLMFHQHLKFHHFLMNHLFQMNHHLRTLHLS